MVQRYEGMVNDQLNTAQRQVQSDYQMIQNLNYQELTSSYSAELLLSMINKLSSKVIGIHKIRADLAEVEFPFVMQHSFIFDKAEVFYYQSIMQDLNRIKNNEMVMQVSREQIRQCVEELNWKINVQRASRLNESQEVQQNMQLMKFFQGVRNYQNWQENIKRQTFTRLKERSHAIENELSFKKGFILSKLERIIYDLQKNNLTQLLKINYRYVKFERISHILHKIRQCRKKQYFVLLFMKTKQVSVNEKLSNMFARYIPKRFVSDLMRILIQIKARKQRIQKLISKIVNHKKKVQFVFKFAALKKLNISPMIKASKYTSAMKLITHVCQRYFVKTLIKNLNIPTRTIFYRLNQKYFTQLRQAFNQFKQNDIEIRLERPNVSYWIKGKILSSLNKHEKQSINLKQTFSKWYLNTHQQKYAKKVYNIWLQGNTTKFTFFMRLKNMVDQMNNQKVSKQLKNFVKVTCDKYHKYEEYNKKYMLARWIEKTRRLRKIQNMFKVLLNVTNQTVSVFKKTSIQKIIEYCKRKHIIKQYCNKYMLQHIENVKIALMKWRKINNIKKEWGRKKLRIILLNNTEQFIKNKRDVLDIFKKHWIQGREKKTIMTRKAITKDMIFLQRFMQFWRHNINNTKAELNNSQKQVNANKCASIIGISHAFKRVQTFELRNIINKFTNKRLQRIRRYNNLKNSFISVVESNQRYLKQETFDIFISNFKLGKLKKDQLISKLVCANVVKQKLGLLIFKNKAHEMTQLLKRQKSTKIFDILQNKLKENYIIFNKRLFIARVLQKIVNNHQQNINTAFQFWKTMPMRIRWKLRSKLIKLHQRLAFYMNQRLAVCNDSFKSSFITAKLKQKKAIYIMACKYEMVLKKYFNIYYRNASIQKEDDKIVHVTRLFQAMVQQQNKNFKIILQSPPVWPKKAASFERLNEYLKRRMQDYLLAWHKNTRALQYFNSIKDEKKKRCLQMFAKVMTNVKSKEAKEVVLSFHNNYKLRKAKMHILKKICDSQAVKILKGFNAWKNLPSVINKLKVQKAANFQSSLIYLIKRNMKITLNSMKECINLGKEMKMQLVRDLVFNISGRVQTLFNKWRQNKNIRIVFEKQNKVENIFNILMTKTKPSFDLLIIGDESSKKTKSLKIIQDYWNKQQKYYIKRWYKNTNNLKMKDLSKKHYLINLCKIKTKHSNTRLVQQVVHKFLKNSDEKLKLKHRNRCNQVAKMIENYESHKRLLLNVIMDKFKFLHIKGNFHKNRAFHRFLTQKIKQVHVNLDIWNKLAQKAKQVHKQKMVSENFDHVQQLVKMNFYLMFARTKDTTIKKNTLDRLFKATELKRKGCFDLWRQNVKALKMMGEMDKQSKAAILQRINKIVQSTSTQAVIQAIKKFNLNSKVERIQRKFVQKLLQTKSGKIITAFKTWKTIPVANTVGKYKNYQKFYFKFQAFYKSRLKFAQSALTETGDQGNLMKKQSILKLFEMTSLGIRRYYNRWTRLTKEKHILMTVNRALKAFESGQEAIANQYQIIFQDQRAYKIKITTIQRLIKASQGTAQNYFNKWRQNVRQFNISQGMDAQKKKMALAMFNKVMGSSQTSQVLHIIELFKKNLKVVKVSKNFFNRLMNTKAGKVMSFFDKLKTIPDAKMNKLKKKGIIFENRLHNFVQKRLRNSLAPFKENIFEANTKKKYCLSRLLRACMGQNQKKFLIWRNVNRQAKILSHTSLFEKMFNNMENIYRGNFEITIKDAGTQIQKKKNLCRKLLNNSLFVQHHAYMIWKEAYHVDDINTKSRQHHYTNHLKNLIGVFNSHENKKIIQVIGVFRKLLEMRHFQQYEYYKSYKNRRCLNIFNNLKKMESSFKFVFISALKTSQAEYILAQKSKRLHSIFQAMQCATKTNMNQILRTENQTALLNKTFERLCSNQMLNISRVFNIWRQNKKILNYKADVKRQKKKEMLKILNSQLIKTKNNKIVKILHKFSQNAKVCNIKKSLLLRVLKNKSDKVPTLFNSWKNIPYQQAKKLKNKATKFQRGLLNFMKNNLREVNDCFKRCHYQGVTKKEEAARTIVRSKLIDINQLFFRWRKFNNQSKITGKILKLDKTLTHLSTIFKDNFTIFDDCKRQDQRKIRGATNLFINNVKRLNGYFNIWRRNSRIIKLHKFQRLMRNFNPQDFNKRLMRIGFLMVAKRQQMEVLKGYINSLWKWKLSNIQASYYTKFINVFKQSQQMIKLSNLINKKIYQNTHHSFRNILSVGHARTNRKRQIVEKYLTRKARNYFLIFKNNTLKSEINIWKSKYTESIKFKIFSDVLTSIFLKTKSSAYAALAKYHNYTKKIDSLHNILEVCQGLKQKDAFYKIKFDGQMKLLRRSDNLYESIRKSNLQEAFDALNYNRKIYRLNNIAKVINKYMKFIAFSKVNRKKERVIKAKLAINLLENMIKQHATDNIKKIINKFNKNRLKRLGAERLFRYTSTKYESYAKSLIQGCKNIQNISKLLERFRRGQMIQKILEKQDEMLKKSYLNKMRKKQNKWMELAIKKFATRASIISCPAAITYWRLKTYASNI